MGLLINHKLESTWKEMVVAELKTVYCSGICLKRLKKTAKNISEENYGYWALNLVTSLTELPQLIGYDGGDYEPLEQEVKQSRYTPWRRLGGEEV